MPLRVIKLLVDEEAHPSWLFSPENRVAEVKLVFCWVVCGIHKRVFPWLLYGEYVKFEYSFVSEEASHDYVS